MDRGSPNPLADMDRGSKSAGGGGVQICCDTGSLFAGVQILQKHQKAHSFSASTIGESHKTSMVPEQANAQIQDRPVLVASIRKRRDLKERQDHQSVGSQNLHQHATRLVECHTTLLLSSAAPKI